MSSPSEKPVVFLCCHPADRLLAERFAKIVRVNLGEEATVVTNLPEENGNSKSWHDVIGRTRLAVLLTSPDFDHDFACAEGQAKPTEMRLVEERYTKGQTAIRRMALRDSAVQRTPLEAYRTVLDSDDPLIKLDDGQRDGRMVQAAEKLRNEFFPAKKRIQTVESLATGRQPGLDVVDITSWMPPARKGMVDRAFYLDQLDAAWSAPLRAKIVSLVGCVGAGKTVLVQRWLERLAAEGFRGAKRVFAWSFADPKAGTDNDPSFPSRRFFHAIFQRFGEDTRGIPESHYAERLAELCCQVKTVLVLDALDAVQIPPNRQYRQRDVEVGQLRDDILRSFLLRLQDRARTERSDGGGSLCLITTREPASDLTSGDDQSHQAIQLRGLAASEGLKMLQTLGAKGEEADCRAATEDVHGHPFSLEVLCKELRALQGDIARRDALRFLDAIAAQNAMETVWQWHDNSPELDAIRVLSFFHVPVGRKTLARLVDEELLEVRVSPSLVAFSRDIHEFGQAVESLADRGLVMTLPVAKHAIHYATEQEPDDLLILLPMLREYVAARLRDKWAWEWRCTHKFLLARLRPYIQKSAQSLEGLSPALCAVYHGCAAGLFKQAADIYLQRVKQGSQDRLVQLAANEEDLKTIGNFFFRKWDTPVRDNPQPKDHPSNQQMECRENLPVDCDENLPAAYKADFLHRAGDRLAEFGRTEEACKAYRKAMEIYMTLRGEDEKVTEVETKLLAKCGDPQLAKV